jgi:hypothetical protein
MSYLFISANKKGIAGDKICLAGDRFEIDDDEMLFLNCDSKLNKRKFLKTGKHYF